MTTTTSFQFGGNGRTKGLSFSDSIPSALRHTGKGPISLTYSKIPSAKSAEIEKQIPWHNFSCPFWIHPRMTSLSQSATPMWPTASPHTDSYSHSDQHTHGQAYTLGQAHSHITQRLGEHIAHRSDMSNLIYITPRLGEHNAHRSDMSIHHAVTPRLDGHKAHPSDMSNDSQLFPRRNEFIFSKVFNFYFREYAKRAKYNSELHHYQHQHYSYTERESDGACDRPPHRATAKDSKDSSHGIRDPKNPERRTWRGWPSPSTDNLSVRDRTTSTTSTMEPGSPTATRWPTCAEGTGLPLIGASTTDEVFGLTSVGPAHLDADGFPLCPLT